MEELYHVDGDDSVVGTVMKDDAHKRGVLHRAGMIFIIRRDGKILLTKRSLSKKTFPNMYDCSCAFHVTFGESYEEAAKRELSEETGIHGILQYMGKFSFLEPPENEMVAVFRCPSNEPLTIDREESTAAVFYSITDVDRIVASEEVTPWLREGWRLVRNHIL
jgi:isopentenyl-diphosphate delta-isomerase type 1